MEKAKMLFSQATINFLLELILIAELKEPTITDRNAFIRDWLAVDWTSRTSILPMIPLIEQAYARAPRVYGCVHRDVDMGLESDGYRIRDGKLRKIVA
jgi:hypothetical protein